MPEWPILRYQDSLGGLTFHLLEWMCQTSKHFLGLDQFDAFVHLLAIYPRRANRVQSSVFMLPRAVQRFLRLRPLLLIIFLII